MSIGMGFFELMTDAGHSDDRHLEAGLFAVLTVEHALAAGSCPMQEASVARDAVRRAPASSVSSILFALLDAAERIPDENARRDLGRSLLSYGVELHAQGYYTAALDAFRVIILHLRDDRTSLIQAYQRTAFAYRVLKQWDEAAIAYQLMEGIAVLSRDVPMKLEARLGPAFIAIEKGNLPAALDGLTSALKEARKIGASGRSVLAKAIAARAAVHGMKLDHVAALLDSQEALDYATTDEERHRIMFNMAYSFREVGHGKAAIHLTDRLAAEAAESEPRVAALVLRMNLAIDDVDELTVARIDRILGAQAITDFNRVGHLEARARSFAAKGRFADAERMVLAAIDVAASAKMGEVLHRCDLALDAIRRGEVPVIYSYQPPKLTTAAKRKVAAVEERIADLCAVGA